MIKQLSPAPMNIVRGNCVKISNWIQRICQIIIVSGTRSKITLGTPYKVRKSDEPTYYCNSNNQEHSSIINSPKSKQGIRSFDSDSNCPSNQCYSKSNSLGFNYKIRVTINLLWTNAAHFKEPFWKTRRFFGTSERVEPPIPENTSKWMRKNHQPGITCSNQRNSRQNCPIKPLFSVGSGFFCLSNFRRSCDHNFPRNYHANSNSLRKASKSIDFKEKHSLCACFGNKINSFRIGRAS